MAIKSISYENFRGQNRKVELSNSNFIFGKNGSGKTTIKEAIIFAFCGCDSIGTRNPTHLISKGKDDAKVIIETDKAIISRTLTRKGSSTIKVERGGTSSSFPQNKFEELVGRPDTFMSAMMPGYFFELDQKLKQAVLEDVFPKIDKVTLLEEIAGISFTSEEKLKYGFHRRADLVASTVAQDRRSVEATINQKKGRIQQLSELTSVEKPTLQDRSAELKTTALNQEMWVAYDRDIKLVNERNASIDRISAENNYLEKRRVELEESLATLTRTNLHEYSPIDISDLQSVIQPLPARPNILSDVASEHCHACGQTVSLKYKDQVKLQNTKAIEEWQNACDQVNQSNALIRSEIARISEENEAARTAYMEILESNRRIESKRMAVQRELAQIQLTSIPEKLIPPPIPDFAYSKTDHLELLKYQDEYKSAWAIYDHVKKELETAREQIDKLTLELSNLIQEYDRFVKIEEALKELPALETKKQIGVFNSDKLVFDGSSVFYDGTPLKMLSTGEKIKVQTYFSRKISELMPKPHHIIFIDDADVVDDVTLDGLNLELCESEQIFKVYVRDQEFELLNEKSR